jgi:hypothetical protein
MATAVARTNMKSSLTISTEAKNKAESNSPNITAWDKDLPLAS